MCLNQQNVSIGSDPNGIPLKELGRLARLSGVRGSLKLPNYPLKQCHSY